MRLNRSRKPSSDNLRSKKKRWLLCTAAKDPIISHMDHRPLIAIPQKAIGDMPSRLHRFFMQLFCYDTNIIFVPGKHLFLADMLSQASINCDKADMDSDDAEVHAVSVVSCHISRGTPKRLDAETTKDHYLNGVLESLSKDELVDGPLKLFIAELSQAQSILLKGCKINSRQYEVRNTGKNSRRPLGHKQMQVEGTGRDILSGNENRY